MSLYVKGSNNKWSRVNLYIKTVVGWKEIKNIYTKTISGWRPIWVYNWFTGDWSACSASCGGGTQSRSVVCQRNDGVPKPDLFCSDIVKPASQQVCNSQPCGELTTRFTDCTYCCPQWGSCSSNTLYMNLETPVEVPGVYGLYLDYKLTYECRRRCGAGDLRLMDTSGVRIFLSVSSDKTNWELGKIDQHWDVYGKANNPRSVQRYNEYMGELSFTQPTSMFVYRAWTQRREHDHGFGIWDMVVRARYLRPLQ